MKKRDTHDRRPIWTSVGEMHAQWKAGRNYGIKMTLLIEAVLILAAFAIGRHFIA